ncbi:MAG: DUF177 domain-containing protein, partial [Planctomycetia bacterium]|nr:DUF177 domain-containing protein [Planctomycetia bacterium]
ATEDEAARRDDPEADFDVLVGSRRFDLVQWIEDELVLELPPVSFHDDCEAPAHRSLELDAAPQTPLDERRRPFAALAGLKAKSSE